MKWLKRLAIALLALLLLLMLGLWWLLGSEAGLRFALARASGLTGGALSVRQASGRLAGPLQLQGLQRAAGGQCELLGAARAWAPAWACGGFRRWA